jgi:cyclopropane fatty-acyl-phospholipid synthase-like methyltransferase
MGLLTPETECLDIGCGIGRMETALAGRLHRIVGVDISAEMVAEANRRTASLPNVEIRQTSGRDLSQFADGSFDLVLAIDSFPYLVGAAGILRRE